MKTDLIPVGISSCLTGKPVRYDGGHKRSRFCMEQLADYFTFMPLCPEMGSGMPAPRPALRLQDDEGAVRLRVGKTGEDHTDAMQTWIEQTLPRVAPWRGYILMGKSPSCGMARIPVYRADGEVIHRDGQGLFAAALQQDYPLLPVEEEGRLNDSGLRENFIERVFFYDDWCRLQEQGMTAAVLIGFHTRHKFQLLAHSQRIYRQLGPLLSNLRAAPLGEIARQYITQAMLAMAEPVRPGDHANAMLHVLGFYRDKLAAEERRAMTEQINAYVREEIPLVVPMTLLRMIQRRFPNTYMGQQQYLSPYPDALGLRNSV